MSNPTDDRTELPLDEIPMIKSAKETMANIEVFRQAMPILRPLMSFFGTDMKAVDEAFKKAEEAMEEVKDLPDLPGRFNDLFAKRGWIMTEMLNVDVARAAVKLAEAGDFDGAEAELVSFYSPENLKWQINWMKAIDAFRPRWRLTMLALKDFEEGRYHACIPVVLALLDGLVNEVHERRRGFFSKGVDLTAWDSLSGHSSALGVLNSAMQKGRPSTTTDEIPLPYRNGILHGTDLGYDTKLVAAKAWAAFFSVRDWAIKAERGQLDAPPPEPKVPWYQSIWQSLQVMDETERVKRSLVAWRPRDLLVGRDFPASGGPEEYIEGSPERRLVEYLGYWIKGNYGHMAACVHPWTSNRPKDAASVVKRNFTGRKLLSYELQSISDMAAAATEIEIALAIDKSGVVETETLSFRMIRQSEDGRPVVGEDSAAQWIIINWHASYSIRSEPIVVDT